MSDCQPPHSPTTCETVCLRLGLEPMWWELKPSQNPAWDFNLHDWDSSPAKAHDICYGPNEAQFLDVSLQKEYSERQRQVRSGFIQIQKEADSDSGRVWAITEGECGCEMWHG
ncbi:unnamed protein product [Rangifer tarandus platyrhynchus]|uniref:Uncharacterized protein n=2 Tax=Rangifer tarandus platyrhynchus TaxID=3082113 RepID=A0ABN8YS56_RANTA|nr:unnamed protein product [Rangifer tarandus platyrhynchus]